MKPEKLDRALLLAILALQVMSIAAFSSATWFMYQRLKRAECVAIAQRLHQAFPFARVNIRERCR